MFIPDSASIHLGGCIQRSEQNRKMSASRKEFGSEADIRRRGSGFSMSATVWLTLIDHQAAPDDPRFSDREAASSNDPSKT